MIDPPAGDAVPPLNYPPLPHLTGKKNIGFGKHTVGGMAALLFFLLMAGRYAYKVFVQGRRDLLLIPVLLLVVCSVLVVVITLQYVRERAGETSR